MLYICIWLFKNMCMRMCGWHACSLCLASRFFRLHVVKAWNRWINPSRDKAKLHTDTLISIHNAEANVYNVYAFMWTHISRAAGFMWVYRDAHTRCGHCSSTGPLIHTSSSLSACFISSCVLSLNQNIRLFTIRTFVWSHGFITNKKSSN